MPTKQNLLIKVRSGKKSWVKKLRELSGGFHQFHQFLPMICNHSLLGKTWLDLKSVQRSEP